MDRCSFGPGLDRALPEREVFVRYDEFLIKIGDSPDPVTGRAGALGAVEGEGLGRDFRIAYVVNDTGEFFAVQTVIALVDEVYEDEAVGLAEGRLDGLGKPALHAGLDHEAVDYDLDGVLLFLVHGHGFGQLTDHSVYPRPDVPGFGCCQELFPVLTLAFAHDRSEHLDARALGQFHDRVGDLLHRLGGDLPPALITMGFTDSRKEQAQIVVDLRDRADRRAGVFACCLLLYGDGRRKALDGVHVGLVHLLQELARVSGEALHVPALAFRIDGVEGEGRLARSRQPGNHHELVPGDLEVDIFQIVLAAAFYDDLVHGEVKENPYYTTSPWGSKALLSDGNAGSD